MSVLELMMMTWRVIGFSDEEPPGEEYEVGEYVLEDLELGSPEKAGSFFFFFILNNFVCLFV